MRPLVWVPTKAKLVRFEQAFKFPKMVKLSPSDHAIIRYALYAKHFQWPPSVVDELPLSADRYLLPVMDIITSIENEAQSGS